MKGFSLFISRSKDSSNSSKISSDRKDNLIEEKKRKKLVDYIDSQIKKKKDIKEMKNNLIKAGWPHKIIDEELKKYSNFGDNIVKHKTETKKSDTCIDEKKNINQPNVMPKDSLIQIKNLSKSYGEHKILDNINLEIKKGEIFGIIGLSGSGKTTLLNTMIGFSKPESGDILYMSQDTNLPISVYKDKKHEVKKTFGFASQDVSFYSRLTAEENLDHFGSLYGLNKKVIETNIDSLLDLTELSDARTTLAGNMSGGMQRRLGIACSLIHDPSVLILDEPTADLDPHLRKEMWALIRKINSQGTTVILTSHFLSELEELCNKIGILHNKQIIQSGTVKELKDKFSKNDEIHLELASGNYSKVIKQLQKQKVKISKIINKDHKIVIYTPEAEKVLHHILHIVERNKEKILDVDVNRPTLSEIFESLLEHTQKKEDSVA